ncbi:TMEM165/GDT1 family protein [Mycolicibacter arupensis]|uniref:TMEM165/GDT1 family protein n=1 Tax=Mycolicibacter arupensis TaxID=342002 RepID=UPI00122C7323|nr:TMEM165/GDT1 family protein [Mycolicibacter arupensis]KAA1428569.1 TMEM165/GDT1 family protein [Mycolicibacter arupensis]
MFAAMLISLGVVFLAELGDKSQLITMTYALRHRWWVVLGGVSIAAFAIHGISVTVGHFLGLTLPARPISAVAGVAFIGFAAWTWRERTTATPGATPVREPRFVLFAVVSSVLLAELGDKTMLATVALASDRNWPGVWLGATAGMVLADGVAIAAGNVLHRRLPEHLLHTAAGLLFLSCGLWILFDEALDWRPVAIASVVGVVAMTLGTTLWRASLHRAGLTAGDDSTAQQQIPPAAG